MLKFLGFLFVVGVAFAIGYQMGREGPDAVMSKARELSSELLSKATALEGSTSLRTSLLNAKSHLVQAKLDLLDKNYGKAVSGLEETAKTLNQGKASAEDEIKPRLDALAKKITDMAAEARALKPGVMTKLNEAVKEVDALLNR